MWWRMIARAVAGILLTAFASQADAGFPSDNFYSKWEVMPAQPTTRDAVVIRHTVTDCHPARAAESVAVNPTAGTIDLYLYIGSDVCDNQVYVDDSEDTVVGYLPAGSYSVRFHFCGNPLYYPDYVCEPSALSPLQFVVSEAGRPRQTIPAWSPGGAAVTLLLLTAIAFFRLRARP